MAITSRTVFDTVVIHDERRTRPKQITGYMPNCRLLIDYNHDGVGHMHLEALKMAKRIWDKTRRFTLILEDDALPGVNAVDLVDDWLRRVWCGGDKQFRQGWNGAISFFLARDVKVSEQGRVDKAYTDAMLVDRTFMRYPDLLHGVAYVLNPGLLTPTIEVLEKRVKKEGAAFTDVDTTIGSVLKQYHYKCVYPLESLFEHTGTSSLVPHQGQRPKDRRARVFTPRNTR